MRLQYGEIIYKTQNIQIQKAVNLETSQTVCVKQYRLHNELQQKSFSNEISSLYRLNIHPNVLKILGHQRLNRNGEYNVEIILEYCKNQDLCVELNRRIANNTFWTESELLVIIQKLVDTFKFLQEEKIAHRDIKPDNILVTDDLELKVSDLGASTLIVSKTNLEVQTIVGTSYYMSPELRKGFARTIGPVLNKQMKYNPFVSDVWSLGLTLLTIVSLQSVEEFNDLENIETITKNRLNQLKNPTIRKIIEKMLVIDENQRPDFIALSLKIAEIRADANKCIFCMKLNERTIWCKKCDSYMHPICLRETGSCKVCSIYYEVNERFFKCLKCNDYMALSDVKVCNHLFCKKCCVVNVDCYECFGFRVIKQIHLKDVEVFTKICCKQCNMLMTVNDRELFCNDCNICLCAICKNNTHEGPCSLQSTNSEIYCRCRMLIPRSDEGLFFVCPLCVYLCVVCYQKPEASHIYCSLLYSSTDNTNFKF